jgi:hypothetical protein
MDLFVEERGMWFGGVVGHSIRSDRSAVSSRLPGAEECGVTDVADGGDESATSATSLSAAAVRNGLVCYDMHTNTSSGTHVRVHARAHVHPSPSIRVRVRVWIRVRHTTTGERLPDPS